MASLLHPRARPWWLVTVVLQYVVLLAAGPEAPEGD